MDQIVFSIFVMASNDRAVPVQFQRTRLLRNPWNGNREVKISRDGTELEPSVGARLLKEFDIDPSTIRPGSIAPTAAVRRMSYPMAPHPTTIPPQLVYQQQLPPMAPGVAYLPYGTVPGAQAAIYNYPFTRGTPQQLPQKQFGEQGQQYPYGQPPPQQ